MPVLRCSGGHEWGGNDDCAACPFCGAAGRAVAETRQPVDATIDGARQPADPVEGDSAPPWFPTLPGNFLANPHASSATIEPAEDFEPFATTPGPQPTRKAPIPDNTVGETARRPRQGNWIRSVAGFELLGELGRGGMGVVYKARQERLNRIVALKMILSGEHAGDEQLARFRIEAEAVAQLQHPNIVQIYEIGEERGCPWFSLEFIDGDSLAHRIEAAPQTPTESARIVQALAQAMHAAHQRGVIHRDLKPANILLTRDNVPKITDFGLAKRLADKDSGQTRSGAIMGTPSYMAPEQAQGKTRSIGPAADIYSLGAILYDLLTGRPPFRGTTLLETLQQVQKLDPVPPKFLQPHVPRDLETICLKALEKDPARRYATAGALADDLGRFLGGMPIKARPTAWWEHGWKWARRRPALAALVSVSVLAAVSLLTLGALWLDSERRAAEEREDQQARIAELERTRAAKEGTLRKHAERNFKRAVGAVDEMLTRAGQQKLAHIPQMERVRHELLQKALAFYKEFREENSSDATIRWENARAQQRVADILDMLGRQPQALESYAAALTLYQELVRESPVNVDYRHDLAATANNLGNLLKDGKRDVDAEKAYRDALRVREQLAAENPGRSEFVLELAKSKLNLAVLLQVRGKLHDAEEEQLAARKTLRALAPTDVAARVELARCLNNLGALQRSLGKMAPAEKNLREARDILETLTAEFKEVPEYRQDLALAHQHVAELHRDSAPAKSLQHYEKALQLRTELAASFPGFPAFRQEAASTLRTLALLHHAQGRDKAADLAYAKSLDIQDRLARDYPHLPDYRRNLASSLNNRAIMLLGSNRLKEGEAALDQAQTLLAALVRAHPDVPDYEMELAGIHVNHGAVCQATGRPRDAEDFYRQALAARRRLAARHPQVPEHQQELASVLLNLATLLQTLRPAEAEKSFLEARNLFADLTTRYPANPDYRHQEAVAATNLGHLLRGLNKTEEAENAWKQALTHFERLAQDFPEDLRYRQELARAANELAIFLLGTDRQAEASATWERAIAVQSKLLADHPARTDFRTELARSLGNRAVLHTRANELVDAEKSYRRAIALLEAQAPTPIHPGHSSELIQCHRNLASLLQSLNRPSEAESSWLRILDVQEALVKNFPRSPDFIRDAVSTLNELGNRLAQKEKFALARSYYQRAVDHLVPWIADKDVPRPVRMAQYLSSLNLATAVVNLGDHAAAAAIVARAAPLDPAASQHQHLAAVLGRCMTLAEKDVQLAPSGRKELARTYGDEALKLLTAAVRQGFKDAAFLQNTDFEPLRARPEFQALLGLR